jgi:hypothetical protein
MMTGALSGAWWLTGNEKRDMMSFDADPNPMMDDYMIPAGLVPMAGSMIDDIALDEANKPIEEETED